MRLLQFCDGTYFDTPGQALEAISRSAVRPRLLSVLGMTAGIHVSPAIWQRIKTELPAGTWMVQWVSYDEPIVTCQGLPVALDTTLRGTTWRICATIPAAVAA
jgi:hypothetical protein